MKMPEKIDGQMLSPCGVNCMVCSAHVKTVNQCVGCRIEGLKPPRCLNCARKRCAEAQQVTYCIECPKYPCQRIKPLNRRYLERYKVDLQENARIAVQHEVENLMELEQARWRCSACQGIISQHDGECSECGQVRTEG